MEVLLESAQGTKRSAKAMSEGQLESVNIPEMDEQHEELYCAFQALKQSTNCAEDLASVIEAVEAHFKAEEDLFEKHKIPNVITHRSEHANFLKRLRTKQAELTAKLEADEDVSSELQQLVLTGLKWLKSHTNAYDAPQYGTFFKDGEYLGN
mmetsp:Transcript_46446/g.85078  ORF Transcript_46446/g.85078 Transcript_46446/m.85078 type:complete len:152 (+) Transcript_46446:60-515(+)